MLRHCLSYVAATSALDRICSGQISQKFNYSCQCICKHRRTNVSHPQFKTKEVQSYCHFTTSVYNWQNKDTGSNRKNKEHRLDSLERTLLRGYSHFLTKFSQLLSEESQKSLQHFSDMLINGRASGGHLFQLYKTLHNKELHHYLTFQAMQRLVRQISREVDTIGLDGGGQSAADTILQIFEDYTILGLTPGSIEYGSFIKSLAHEAGREEEALQILDNIVDRSDIAPFLQSLRRKRGQTASVSDMIPSEDEITRIEKTIIEETEKSKQQPPHVENETATVADKYILAGQEGSMDDRLLLAARQSHQSRLQKSSDSSDHQKRDRRPISISRPFYHIAMSGFAEIYHVRGVMSVLSRMLETATLVPFRIARHMMPNKETWNIVSEVLVRQQDRPTFVKTWVEFLSRGARPPLRLTRNLAKMLVKQSCVEQAVWVMRISRCLPDVGGSLPRIQYATDYVPWDLKVQVMYVSSALEAATSLDAIVMTREDAMRQGRSAAKLPLLAEPDSEVYAYLISGAVRMGSEKLARHLFQELVNAGIVPNSATFAHLASLYQGKGDIQKVFLIARSLLVRRHQLVAYERIQQGELSTPSSRDGFKGKIYRQTGYLKSDVECIAPLLQFYIHNGREQEAMALLRSWDKTYKNRVPAEKLVQALLSVYRQPSDASKINHLLETLASEKAERQDPSDSSDNNLDVDPSTNSTSEAIRAYAQTIKAHMRARNLQGTITTLREMSENKLVPALGMWDLVLRACLYEQALDLFDAVHAYLRDTLRIPLPVPIYSLWMRTLRNHGDVGGVQAAFDELVELGQLPNQSHYQYLVQTYAYNGWIERATSIVENLRRNQGVLRPGLNLNIAAVEAHAICGNMEQAEAELRYLLDNTPLPHNRIPARPFNYVIIGHLYNGEGRKAMRLYKEMIRMEVKPDVYTFAILMQSYAVSHDLNNCTRVFNEMIRVGVAPDLVIYTILICAFGVARKTNSAEMVFNQVSQEQEWAQRQMTTSKTLLSGADDASDILDIYTESPERLDGSEMFEQGGRLSIAEQMRIRSFYNLDPIIYIAMLKVYNNTGRPMRALATWERMITNYPVAQWNPRKGGSLSKSLRYTGDFHPPALTLLLRTVRESIGVQSVLQKRAELISYMLPLLYPDHIAAVLRQRLGQKRALSRLLEEFRPGRGSSPKSQLLARIQTRIKYVAALEKELDIRVLDDHAFCVKHRHGSVPEEPTFSASKVFSGLGYWIPEEISQMAEFKSLVENEMSRDTKQRIGRQRLADTLAGSFINPDGTFAQTTAYDMAAIIARQWQDIEEAGFKFNNIHISEYIPCLLVGRQYSQLTRFLSLVEPKAPPSKDSGGGGGGGDTTEYRYRNIDIGSHLTTLLLRQIKVVHRLLLADQDRRNLLSGLLGADEKLHRSYASESKYGAGDTSLRTADELQVMRERRDIYSERELSRSLELRQLVQLALLWRDRVDSEGSRRAIDNAIRGVYRPSDP